MAKRWSVEEEDVYFDHFDDPGKEDAIAGFDASDRPVSEKLRRQASKADRKKGAKEDPLRKFGNVVRAFVLENIKAVDYRDIAKLSGISAEELKSALEKAGIKVADDTVPRWKDIDMGEFESVSDCARCQVQRRHSSFIVGKGDCRVCYERNIKHWILIGEPIRITFREKD
jgi:hypothetical protein